MYDTRQKKMIPINILNILRKYTDEDHRLSQTEIAELLEKEYGIKVERKAIRRNLMNLIDSGYEIEYSESIRQTPVMDPKTKKAKTDPKTGEKIMQENIIWSDFYLERDFSDNELRLLIDGLLFSRHIPYSQCKELVEKLEGLSNIYFRSRMKHISLLPEDKTDNKQLFWNIEQLDEAIGKQKKVSFKYLEYDTDKQPHKKCRSNGEERLYVVSPYQMAAREGKYYLICNYDKYDDVSNYRIDRITDIEVLDEKAKPFEDLDWSGGMRLDLAEYMKEHPYMYASENIRAKIRIIRPMIGDILEMFGSDVTFSGKTDTHVDVRLRTNEMALIQFAKNYAPDVEVLEPKGLREKVKEELAKGLACYETGCVKELPV